MSIYKYERPIIKTGFTFMTPQAERIFSYEEFM